MTNSLGLAIVHPSSGSVIKQATKPSETVKIMVETRLWQVCDALETLAVLYICFYSIIPV